MKKVNVIAVFDENRKNVLMCKRNKHPYAGLFNFVGGKVEKDESNLDGAYRELFEETGIEKNCIDLFHMMDFTFYVTKIILEVYVGKLKERVILKEEANPILWMNLNQDFFDKKFAGEGNIGHIMENIYLYENEIFK